MQGTSRNKIEFICAKVEDTYKHIAMVRIDGGLIEESQLLICNLEDLERVV